MFLKMPITRISYSRCDVLLYVKGDILNDRIRNKSIVCCMLPVSVDMSRSTAV